MYTTIKRKLLISNIQQSSDSPSVLEKKGIIHLLSFILGKNVFAPIFVFSIIVIPLLAEAGFFSFFENLFGGEDDVETVLNIQTVPLLGGAYAADLKAGLGGGDITIVGGSALLSVTGPLGSLVDIEKEANRSTTISIYVVREGDTLSGIADMFDVSVNTIIWANDIKRGNIIQTGQTLLILPISGIQYTVKKGDTVSSIAKKYKGDIDEIIAYNNFTSDIKLEAGEVIIIPNGEINVPAVSSSGRVVRGGGPQYAGYYIRPITGGRKSQGFHGYNGVDLATSCGAPVIASAPGNVIIARPYGWNGGYGQYVAITHANGTQTLYAHLGSIIIGAGWHVFQGQVIGYVGSTGLSTGCHVHFEVRGAANPF